MTSVELERREMTGSIGLNPNPPTPQPFLILLTDKLGC